MYNNEENSNKCMAEILQVILLLQRNADCGDSCLDTCDRGFLGCGTTTYNCNTRPVMLYTCCGNGVPWSMPISKNADEEIKSSVFRIEKLDCNCATFRVLANNTDETTRALQPYVTTNSFFTMNLSCLCSIRCLQDTYVDCI